MADFALTEEQADLRALAADIGKQHVRPVAASADEDSGTPREALRQLHSSGLVGGRSEDSGGQGRLDTLQTVLVAEELGACDPGIAWAAMSGGWVASAIDELGTAHHRDELAQATAAPGWLASPLVGEGYGRDLDDFRASSQRSSEGWRLQGTKDPVVNGVASDFGVVVVREGPDVAAYHLDQPALRQCRTVRDDAAGGALGLRAARTAQVDLASVEVGSERRLASGSAVRQVVDVLRLTSAAIGLGLGRAAVDYATEYAKERQAFGSRVIDFQAISFLLVDLTMELEVARLAVWEAAVDLDDGDGRAANESGPLSPVVSQAIARVGRALPWIAREAVQVLGGHGFLADHPVERWYRDAATLVASEPGMSPLRSLSI